MPETELKSSHILNLWWAFTWRAIAFYACVVGATLLFGITLLLFVKLVLHQDGEGPVRMTAGNQRTSWHPVPCCVGNISRTLLMLPTWTYAKDASGINVNLFVGSRINVGEVAGTTVEMVQQTDYPWKGAVAITVNPAKASRFAVRVRIPNRTTSLLYDAEPRLSGFGNLTVNGQPVTPEIHNGYATITRLWNAGDRIALELPLAAQRIKADHAIEATRGKIALRYGPLVYNAELADQARIDLALSNAPLSTEWRQDLLNDGL